MAPRGELIPRGGSDARRALTKARRVVVKVGSNLVTAPGLGSDPDRIEVLRMGRRVARRLDWKFHPPSNLDVQDA